ncbi:NTF2A [Scenedesmus sp. PABB004]|nr:NTF2A [Scenedesmus sp. PABB004]
MADPEAVGKAFLQYYYQLFESNRPGLSNLYQDGSMLTFEGQKFQGTQAIVGKLTQLPFNQCKVSCVSMDFQPSVSGGIMVFVTGSIVTEGESNALKFSQVFHLVPVGSSFVVSNDMFRLNYG